MFCDHVLYRSYADKGYVLNLNTNRSYVFDETAAFILSRIATGEEDEKRIAEALAREYDVSSAEETRRDTADFLRMLRREGILAPVAVEQPGPMPEDHITDYCWAHHRLMAVSLELTYRCNERCVHCYTCDAPKEKTGEMTAEEYFRLMDELRDLGVNELVLSGGEIGTRPDLSRIYRYASERGFLVTLMTNGTLFTPEQMEMFYAYPPKIVYVSFYGGSPETHDRVTQVPGSFKKSLDTVMRLKCAGIAVGLKTVAMTPTADDFPNIVKLAERLRVGLGTGMYLTCGNNGSTDPARYRLTDLRDYERVVEAKQKYPKARTPYRVRDVNGPICEAGVMAFTVNPYGDYYVCTSLPVPCGNVRTTPVAEFWEHDPLLQKIRSLRFSDTGCGECEYRNECVYCVGANYVETGGLFAVQEGHCLAAKAYHRYFAEQMNNGEGQSSLSGRENGSDC
ncbi:MAG: PqqD family peptide modification chaperone [Clostridia bacterium]|nr:PqqD family peptide modification chaperone [Clostridia bacterium]